MHVLLLQMIVSEDLPVSAVYFKLSLGNIHLQPTPTVDH